MMIIQINDLHPNYFNIKITTRLYRRHKYYSKINLLKYSDVKFIFKIPIIYRKSIENKWVLVDYNLYIDPITKRFLIGNVLRDSIIRDPFLPLKYLNKKFAVSNNRLKMGNAFLNILFVLMGFIIFFAIIYSIIYFS